MKRIVAGLGVMACLSFSGVRGQNIDNPPIQGECLTWWCEVVRCPDGSMTFGELVIWPESPLCVGTTIYASPNMDATCGEPVGVFRWAPETTNCPPVYWTNACSYPHSVTNWWVVNHPGFSASGAGLGVQFTPTNCGSGTISFYNVWTNINPCTGLDGCGGGLIAVSRDFMVLNVEITPNATNAMINRCLNPDNSVTFCLTNSCYPGGVAWLLDPGDVPNGARISGNGGCATVTLGEVDGQYTVWAISNDNTNCYSSASLSVARDCDCTHHIKNNTFIPRIVSGDNCGGTNAPWSKPATNSPCGQTAQLVCVPCNQANPSCSSSATCFILYLGGSDVGHCLYDQSIISAGVFKCNCGDVFVGSEWIIANLQTGNGYSLETTCGSRDGPNCFDTNGNPRTCNGGCDDY